LYSCAGLAVRFQRYFNAIRHLTGATGCAITRIRRRWSSPGAVRLMTPTTGNG